MAWKTLDDMDLAGKVVLTRVDINVPVEDGRVTDATRIERIVPTIRDILAKGGKPVLLAHFDRPKGKVVPEMSLQGDAAGARGGARPAGRLRRGLRRRGGRGGGRGAAGGRRAAAGEHPLPQGRGGERPGVRRGAGGARRRLLQRRLLGGAPGARLDRGAGAAAAGLRRAADAGRARGAGEGARRARSGRWWRWSAAPRSRPSSSCSAT